MEPEEEVVALEADESASPYKNLWMPLVIVPGMIVIVLVLVFLAFGGIAGRDPSIADNLQVLTTGGKNERTQAAFSLSQKIASNSFAALNDEELPWPVPEDLTEQVRASWDAAGEEEYSAKFVLASLLAQLGDSEGVPHLIELLDIPESEDEGRKLCFQVLVTLGTFGDARATPHVVKFAESEDVGLRSIVAIVLQGLEGEEVVSTLEGLVHDPELEVRANAAISLAKMGNGAGVPVLFAMLDLEVYRAENEADRARFRTGEVVSQSRRKALTAIARLGRAEDRARVEGLKEDPDLEFRGVVLDSLAHWGGE
ncbi:MAG: HEAT repeat protein [Planctomycetota bacterium]|jgi:HEAT repeat protein